MELVKLVAGWGGAVECAPQESLQSECQEHRRCLRRRAAGTGEEQVRSTDGAGASTEEALRAGSPRQMPRESKPR